jgi:hypothetical protein
VFAVESPRNPRWTNDEMRAVPFGPNTSESKRYRTKTACTVRLWYIVLAQAPDFFRTVQKPAAVCTVIVFQQETRSVDYSEHVIISKQEMVGAPPRNKKKRNPRQAHCRGQPKSALSMPGHHCPRKAVCPMGRRALPLQGSFARGDIRVLELYTKATECTPQRILHAITQRS